jgi:hypothetical protein
LEKEDLHIAAQIGTCLAGFAAVVALLISAVQLDLTRMFREEDRIQEVRPFLVPTAVIFDAPNEIEIQNLGRGVAIDVSVAWEVNKKWTKLHSAKTIHVLPNEATKLRWIPKDIQLPDVLGTKATLLISAKDIDQRLYRYSLTVESRHSGDTVEVRLSDFETLD